MAKLKITQVKSRIGGKPNMKRTLDALGILRNRKTVEHEDTPQMRGMIRVVRHLVSVEEV